MFPPLLASVPLLASLLFLAFLLLLAFLQKKSDKHKGLFLFLIFVFILFSLRSRMKQKGNRLAFLWGATAKFFALFLLMHNTFFTSLIRET
jgi:phosphoglycerol transferase MdoB-like AlkP superfamily enzyme